MVLRSAWDYPRRRNEFLAWIGRIGRLAKPADVVEWNTDKRYLTELAAAAVPVVPTRWFPPGVDLSLPGGGVWVIKPVIGAGSQDAGRYDVADPRPRALAHAHGRRLHAAGRAYLVQPYLTAVDTGGETALIYLDVLADAHAVRKGPLLTGPHTGVSELFKPEDITVRTATPAEREVGAARSPPCRAAPIGSSTPGSI